MRKQAKRLVWTIVAGALAVPLAALAQAGAGPGPGKMAGGRVFDPSAVTTIQGKITDVQRSARNGHEGIHLTVAEGSENVAVHLGPDFYVDAQKVKLAKGDDVEVKGSRTTFDGKPVLIAQEVRRGDEVLKLRDANGLPLWRGQGPRSR